jgi:hypothetical protein
MLDCICKKTGPLGVGSAHYAPGPPCLGPGVRRVRILRGSPTPAAREPIPGAR